MLCLTLQGCASTDFFANRVSCTVSGGTAFVNSMYGPLGITSKIAASDATVICTPTSPK